jgi:hypothetical protein|tara:strand:- start:111 stop:356 length:246 start_codon:yes stop_codon:yes gene_type:complete
MDWSDDIVKKKVGLEIEYLSMLESEGMDQSVLPFLSLLSEMNNKPISHFVIMALEELKIYLDQEPEYEIDLDEDCTEDTVH